MGKRKNQPLTLNGIEDAINIKEKYNIKFTIDGGNNENDSQEDNLMNYIQIDAILTSPLTRAIQTVAYCLGFNPNE